MHPSPTASLIYRATGVGAVEVPDTYVWKTHFSVVTNDFTVGLQNGILCWAVMGTSSTVGAGPYTHTITAAPTVPSFTMQHEATGTATAWSTQVVGCKVAAMAFVCSLKQKYLIGHVDWIGKWASDPGFQLTTTPALPATATTGAYPFTGLTRTFDGASIDGLMEVEFTVSPDLEPILAQVWDGATWLGDRIYQLLEGPRKLYELRMDYTPDSDDMWDELVAHGNTKNVVLKWAKSTNDYIQFTLTDCQFKACPTMTPRVGEEHLVSVMCEPRSVSITVVDSIPGSAYGE